MLRELGRGELSRSATAIIAILSSSRCCEATWRRAGRWSGALVRARWPTGTAMDGSLRARRALLYTHGIPIHQWLWAQLRQLCCSNRGGWRFCGGGARSVASARDVPWRLQVWRSGGSAVGGRRRRHRPWAASWAASAGSRVRWSWASGSGLLTRSSREPWSARGSRRRPGGVAYVR